MDTTELLDLLYKLLIEQISEEEQNTLFAWFEEYIQTENGTAFGSLLNF